MPKAYVIFTETIHDPEGMNAYGAKAMPTIMKSAKVLTVDDSPVVLEGEWPGQRTVMLEFSSVEEARAWCDSPEYQEAIPLRQAAGDCNAVILQGFELPAR
ncbi:MAG: DUF1330 domain-containing protein [Mycobacteriales bacterium]